MSRTKSLGALDIYGLGGLMADEEGAGQDDDEEEEEEEEGGEDQEEADSPSEVVWDGTLESGTYESLELVHLDRSLYLRVRLLPGKGPWSTPLRIPAAAHLDRSVFHDEDVVFNGSAAGASQDHADVRMARQWKLRGTRRVLFYSEYWIMNKTGLALSYLPTPDDFGGGRDWGRDLVLSDRDHADRFGLGTRLPVMLSCPLKTLRAMPYELGPRATTAGLYLSELSVRPSLLHYVNPSFTLGCRLFSDSPLTVASLPPPLEQEAGPRRLAVVTQRQREASTALPGGSSSSSEAGLSFRISDGAYVHVCLDARYAKGERRPSWLASQGFRAREQCPAIRTSDPEVSFVVFSRFFSAGSLVELGLAGLLAPPPDKPPTTEITGPASAARMLLRSLSSRDDGGSSAAASAAAKARASSSQNEWPFFVVVTEPGGRGGEGGSQADEVDVQCVEVQRDMRDQLWCRASYGILPAVRPGDRPYVDRPLAFRSLPAALEGRPLVAVQTAQSDRRAGNGFTLRFTVLQASWVVVGFDSRAKSLPYWVYSQGLHDTGLRLEGLDDSGYHYNLWQKHVPANTTVCLGGNSAVGARGLRRMYLVLVTLGQPLARATEAEAATHADGLGAGSASVGDVELLVQGGGREGGQVGHDDGKTGAAPTPPAESATVAAAGTDDDTPSSTQQPPPAVQPVADTGTVAVIGSDDKVRSSSSGKEPPSLSGPGRMLSPLPADGAEAACPTAPFWSDRMSSLHMMAPLFDLEGRDWSHPFNVDAVNTTGQLETSCAVLGVSIKPLPGLFQRTKAVTLFPRFVVVNQLGSPVQVLPILRPPPPPRRGVASSMASILPSAFSSSSQQATEQQGGGGAKAGGGGGRSSRGASMSGPARSNVYLDEQQCVSEVAPGQCLALYSFLSLQHLPPGLPLPPGYLRDAVGSLVTEEEAGLDRTRAICLRLVQHAAAQQQQQQQQGGAASGPSRDAASFSQPVAVEEVGETCVWLWRDGAARSKGPLVSATVTVEGPTVFLTLQDVSPCPPYRIENRSSWATLLYKQQGTEGELTALEPMTWHSYTWHELDDVRKLKVAVKGYETESSSYALDEVGRKESMTVGKAFLGNSSRRESKLHVEVAAVGRTRVISFSDVRGLSSARSSSVLGRGGADELSTVALLKDMYKFLDVQVDLSGLTVNLLEASSEGSWEVAALTVDRLYLYKEGGRDRADFCIHHLQVDDMRPESRMPVILQPADSGFNTERRVVTEGGRRVVVLEQCPFVRVMVEPNLLSPGVTHYRGVEMLVKEVELHVDLDYLLFLIAYLGRLSTSSDHQARQQQRRLSASHAADGRRTAASNKIDENSRHVVRKLLHAKLAVPERVRRSGPSVMVYLELFHHSSLIVTLEFLAGPKQALDLDPGGLDDALESGLELLGAGFVQVLGAVARSVAQLCPTFVFNELLLTHFFGSPADLARSMRLSMRQQAVTQSYKLLGSMDILGNPISLLNKMGNGVVEFIRRTGAEMVGDSDNRGEGVRKLVQGVVGGAFGSAAKITGTLAGVVEGVAGLHEQDPLRRGRGGVREKPQHLGDGLVQGGQVFYKSMRTGVTGLVHRPREGASKEGFAGLLKGIGKGIVGAVAAPVVGTLGAFSRVTESVDATVMQADSQTVTRRLPHVSHTACAVTCLSRRTTSTRGGACGGGGRPVSRSRARRCHWWTRTSCGRRRRSRGPHCWQRRRQRRPRVRRRGPREEERERGEEEQEVVVVVMVMEEEQEAEGIVRCRGGRQGRPGATWSESTQVDRA